VQFVLGAPVLLTMLPDTPLTIMLEPGQSISSVTPGDGDDFKIRVAADRGSFMVLPTPEARTGTLGIATQDRTYTFVLRVEASHAAALVVRFVDPPEFDQASSALAELHPVSLESWRYRLRGDREVRPANVTDDGYKTRISYAPGQALPAVFAIGPTGEEEVVNGYMRDDVFVIDRVYGELVFRIDKDKATARRNESPEEAP
jgi:type IV secretion system protein VirB9